MMMMMMMTMSDTARTPVQYAEPKTKRARQAVKYWQPSKKVQSITTGPASLSRRIQQDGRERMMLRKLRLDPRYNKTECGISQVKIGFKGCSFVQEKKSFALVDVSERGRGHGS
jgi:hypothetical protein